MKNVLLFPFADYWWLYLGFVAFVLIMLLLDLGVFHRKAHQVSTKEAVGWTVFWISLALIFNFLLFKYAEWRFPQVERLMSIPGFDPNAAARQVGMEFLAGFVVEKALALDNMFVFVLVFTFFAIPDKYQHRVLFFGILGALVFRTIFIALGAVLLKYHLVVVLAGVFLIFTGLKILFAPEKPQDPEKNPIIKGLRKLFPVTKDFHGQKFFVRINNVLHITPLFVALVFIEISDIIFAIDSVPAIFALTKEPLIVFTSNVFAILGLRAMYFLLADLMHRFTLLKYSLGVILIFVGLKMVWLNDAFGGKFPIAWSLAIIGGLLAVGIGASLLVKVPKEEEEKKV